MSQIPEFNCHINAANLCERIKQIFTMILEIPDLRQTVLRIENKCRNRWSSVYRIFYPMFRGRTEFECVIFTGFSMKMIQNDLLRILLQHINPYDIFTPVIAKFDNGYIYLAERLHQFRWPSTEVMKNICCELHRLHAVPIPWDKICTRDMIVFDSTIHALYQCYKHIALTSKLAKPPHKIANGLKR